MGFGTDFKMAGFVERKANKFTIHSEHPPQDFAKPMQRLMVGSSNLSSAVDGLSPINAIRAPSFAHWRLRKYRYLPSSEKTAGRVKSKVTAAFSLVPMVSEAKGWQKKQTVLARTQIL